jgi:hypothetical protein
VAPKWEDVAGFVEVAGRDERLEQVAELELPSRLEGERASKLVGASEVGEPRSGASQRELDEAEHPGVARLRNAPALGLGAGDCLQRYRACGFDTATVRGKDGGGKLDGRTHAAELRAEVERAGDVPLGFLPLPGPPFKQAQIPQRVRLRGWVPRDHPTADLLVEHPRAVDVPRPPELVTEGARRTIVERPLGQRSLD